ncbi:MAG: hypothetical protein CL885_04100 [Dehalococcoidia bacterium]|nr:hypothetical protein [Dehalococcoidia bacterium]
MTKKKPVEVPGMKMFYKRDGEFIEYIISPDPPEALFWSTYRLKKGDIFLKVKLDKKIDSEIIQEILDDILSQEPRPKKANKNEILEKRKAAKPTPIKIRQTKRKTGS